MTSQRVEKTWIRTGGYGRFRGEWVKIPMTSYFPANYKVKCRKIEIFRIESLHFYPYQFRIGSYIKVIVLIKQTK